MYTNVMNRPLSIIKPPSSHYTIISTNLHLSAILQVRASLLMQSVALILSKKPSSYLEALSYVIAALVPFGSCHTFLDCHHYLFVPPVAFIPSFRYSLCSFLLSFPLMRSVLSAASYPSLTVFMYK